MDELSKRKGEYATVSQKNRPDGDRAAGKRPVLSPSVTPGRFFFCEEALPAEERFVTERRKPKMPHHSWERAENKNNNKTSPLREKP